MSCDSFRESLLEFEWDEATRQQAAALLEHLQSCPECRSAATDFDHLRKVLVTIESDIEPVGGWKKFEQRLLASGGLRKSCFWRVPLMAIAASLVIAAASFQVGRALPGKLPLSVAGNRAVSQPGGESPLFAPQQVDYEVRAFDQVSKFFDGRASWILVSNDASAIGTTNHPIPGSGKVLLLRLTTTRGDKIASDADLVLIPGETANLTLPIRDGQSLRYQIGTAMNEPNRLSVRMEVQTPRGAQPLATLSTILPFEPGRRVTAGQLATSAGDYELKIAFAREDLPQTKS